MGGRGGPLMIEVTDIARTEITKAIDGKGENPTVRIHIAGYG